MKKLAIIGASYLQMPLVLKAKEMGLETHCFAWEEGAVCKSVADFFYPISILEKENILDICRKIKIDGITSIASDAAVPTICYVASQLGLISNNYEDALVMTDKFEMRNRFIQYKVSCPKFTFASEAFSVEGFRCPLIVKPTDRSGSRGVMKVSDRSQLQDAINRAKKESFSNQAIVEEFISGVEVSVEAISWKGKHYILTITDKVTTGSPCFVELEHHQPSQLSKDIQLKIKDETIKALNAINVKYGASHSEFKITETGEVVVIEVGARMGGDFIGSDLVMLSTGYDFLKGVIEVALNEFNVPILNYKSHSGVYFLSKEAEYIKPYIVNYKLYPQIVKVEITNEELKNITCSADRSGYLIYQSDKKLNFKNGICK